MPIDVHPKRMPPQPEEIIAEQKRRAAKDKAEAAAAGTAVMPAGTNTTGTAVAAPDTRTNAQRTLDEIAPTSIAGRLVKFSKDGEFVVGDDEAISGDDLFVALCGETQIGWIKFNGKDTPPSRVAGLLYGDFRLPPRESLGDTDEAQWEDGLSGAPEDPWKCQFNLVLQSVTTSELYTFTTMSKVGRRAVANLLRHYDRLQQTNPGDVPVVSMKPGGYTHKKIGWVATPMFVIVGHTPRDSAAQPDTSVADDMGGDSIPF
jgi:hypothetical protein